MSNLEYYHNKGEEDGSEGHCNYDPPRKNFDFDWDYKEAYDEGWSYAVGQYDYNNNYGYRPKGNKESYDDGWNNAKEQDDD